MRRTRKSLLVALAMTTLVFVPAASGAGAPERSVLSGPFGRAPLGRPADPARSPRYPLGRVVEKIACRVDPRFSFALYLPTTFDPDRSWPLLFLFDARGRGAMTAERFRAGAERFGWILISSNDTRSDDAAAPNADVLQTLWSEAHARFRLNARRIYAGGFSGGARLAFLIGLARKGSLAGVIAASGGPPSAGPADSDPGFPVFGTAGDRDFNYREMRALDRSLAKVSARHRLVVFPGSHEWPPAEIATQAIGWLEMEAMRAGTRPRDEALAQELLRESIVRVDERERAGDLAGAYEEAQSAALGFAGFVGAAQVETAERRAALLREPARLTIAEAEHRDAREAAAARRLLDQLDAILASETPVPPAAAAGRLEIAHWRSRAAAGPEPERLSAQRVLETLFTQAAFYKPRAFFERKDPRRAARSLEIATAAEPERPVPWYDLACARALAGDAGKAIDALHAAVARGFSDTALLRTDPDLASLRGRTDFRAIADELAARPKP